MINVTLAVVAVLSLAVAVIMSGLAWTTRRDERRRAGARVSALARAIYAEDLSPPRAADAAPIRIGAPAGLTKFAMTAGAGLLTVTVVTGLTLMTASTPRKAGPASPLARANPPLELLLLEQDRDDNRLVVRGIVRNPSSAATLPNLTAVVLVFTKDGSFISSGRALVASRALAPGAEAAFVVALPDADSVDRYRVSFRADDRIVPHIDRRAHHALARTE
jgi:hypothetical protein